MKSKDELLELILNDTEAFNEYMQENRNAGVDLSEVDLSDSDVKDLHFINTDLTSSTFSDSHLVNVKFEECDLSSADFTRSSVTECDFAGSVLNGADFSYAVCDYCNFNEADMAGAVFQETDLSNSDLTSSYNLNACRFDDGTVWPDTDMLPDNFDGMYSSDLSSLQDDEDEEDSVSDY